MADIAWDDLFFLQGLRNTKRMVYHSLLHRVHLREGWDNEVKMNRKKIIIIQITSNHQTDSLLIQTHSFHPSGKPEPEPDARGRGTFPWHPLLWEHTPHHNDSAAGRTSICFRASRMFLLFIRSHPWPAGTLPGQCVCVCVCVCECMCLMKPPIVDSEYWRESGDGGAWYEGDDEMKWDETKTP